MKQELPEGTPTFGEALSGERYSTRPSAYAVILENDRLAVIHTGRGYFLPGGGCDGEESPMAALRREVREECGRAVEVGRKLGEALEYLYAESDGRYYRIESTFYEATLGKPIAAMSERDHRLAWLDAAEAIELLRRKSQAWAVQQAVRTATDRGRARREV